MTPEDSSTTNQQEPVDYFAPDQAEVVQPQDELSSEFNPAAEHEVVSWQAPEYVARYKSPLWYVAFVAVVIVLIMVAVFVIKSWSFAVLLPVMAVALFAFSARPPRMINYSLSEKGLYINDTLHGMSEFKAFGVLHELDHYSLELIPVRRFRPKLSVGFDQASGEDIVDIMGTRLPMEDVKLDAFDKIVRFIGL